MNNKLLGIAGIIVILAIAFVLSTNRKAIRPRVVGAAFALQAVIAWLVLWTSWGRAAIQWLSFGVANLLGYAGKGTEFLFGPSDKNPLANSFAIASSAKLLDTNCTPSQSMMRRACGSARSRLTAFCRTCWPE